MSTSSSQPTNPSSSQPTNPSGYQAPYPSGYQPGEQSPYRAGEQPVYDHRDAPPGPNVPALVIGSLAVLVAVAVALAQWGWYTVDLEASGPWIIVGAGVVLLAAGIFSLVRGGNQR
ncbi:hypothetical protein MM440_10245 [Arsenicicoccus piscis]|uniref:LPXTG cell wall anchor domain-containing protein n=1 Tax=Arsenicicoccus piscis TaxID=673954 RepID=A0ABQ6HRY5_9MICO|nr:hypothetical protein [Arsenicicoccus piscis]MCH8628146.1 hypothetical protein [Arsenicicoccus piscis]GMA20474.1 hypothetical protein GCM10025862_24950 [Arsenicicoccus piscis]